MYDKILVPIDGSETAVLGLNEAVRIAKCVGGKIRLVHFVNEVVLDYAYGSGVYATDLIDSLRKGGQACSSGPKPPYMPRASRPNAYCSNRWASDLILAQAADWGADLIVMGTHGRRGLARVAMGSDAEEVVRSTMVPVLLVRGASAPRSDTVTPKPLEASAA